MLSDLGEMPQIDDHIISFMIEPDGLGAFVLPLTGSGYCFK